MSAKNKRTIRLCIPCDTGNKTAFHLHPFIGSGGWEGYCSKPWWNPASGIPTLDETIAAGYGFCLGWGLGAYETTPPIIGYDHEMREVRCSPCGLEMFGKVNNAVPGWVEALRPRCDAAVKNGTSAMLYVGSVPLNLFNANSWISTKTRRCDALLAPVIAAGFTHIAFDASAACGQSGWTTPTRWIMDRAERFGLTPCVNAIPVCHPDMFPWATGEYAVVEEYPLGVQNGPGYFNSHCPGTFHKRFLWVQGSILWSERKDVAEVCVQTPIVDFGDAMDWADLP